MEHGERLATLNRAWLVAQELIRECYTTDNSELSVDCQRLQASIQHIERALGFDMEKDVR